MSHVADYDRCRAHWCARSVIVFSYRVLLAVPALAPAHAACTIYSFVDDDGVMYWSNVPADRRCTPIAVSPAAQIPTTSDADAAADPGSAEQAARPVSSADTAMPTAHQPAWSRNDH